jgi:hypothetical protein
VAVDLEAKVRARPALTAAILLAVALGHAMPSAVATQPPNDCYVDPDDDYNVGASNNKDVDEYIAIRGLVHLGNYDSDCVRVSSLGAIKPDGRFVEWGWVLGYDDVTAAYHSRPFLFYCYKTALTRQCRSVGEKDDNELTFRVDDANQDFIWEFYLYSYYQNVRFGGNGLSHGHSLHERGERLRL